MKAQGLEARLNEAVAIANDRLAKLEEADSSLSKTRAALETKTAECASLSAKVKALESERRDLGVRLSRAVADLRDYASSAVENRVMLECARASGVDMEERFRAEISYATRRRIDAEHRDPSEIPF